MLQSSRRFVRHFTCKPFEIRLGQLRGVDGDTGAVIYSATNSCAGVAKWTSPIAVKGRIVVAGNGRLCAWGIPGALTQ